MPQVAPVRNTSGQEDELVWELHLEMEEILSGGGVSPKAKEIWKCGTEDSFVVAEDPEKPRS